MYIIRIYNIDIVRVSGSHPSTKRWGTGLTTVIGDGAVITYSHTTSHNCSSDVHPPSYRSTTLLLTLLYFTTLFYYTYLLPYFCPAVVHCLTVLSPTIHIQQKATRMGQHSAVRSRDMMFKMIPYQCSGRRTPSGMRTVHRFIVGPGALTTHGMLQLCLQQLLYTGSAALIAGAGTRVLPDQVRTCTTIPQ